MKPAVVPASTHSVFEEGQHCITAVPGDLVLVRRSGVYPALIGIGQHTKYWMLRVIARKKEYEAAFCRTRHAMIIVEGGANATVSQMESHGGQITPLYDYVALKYAVVHTTDTTQKQRDDCVGFAKWCVGVKYGFFTIGGMILNIFVPVVTITLTLGMSMVCSTASSLAQRCLGFIPSEPDASLFPADLARYHGVRL